MNARRAGTREMTTATGTDAVALLLAYLLGRGLAARRAWRTHRATGRCARRSPPPVAAMPPGMIPDVPARP